MIRLTTTIRTTAGSWLAALTPPPRQLLSLAVERHATQRSKKRPVPNPFAPRIR